jgi:hypothetical protein
MRAHAQTQEVRIGSLLRWVLGTIIRLVSVASATSRAPTQEAVMPFRAYFETGAGISPIVCREWTVASVLEPGGRYFLGGIVRITATRWGMWAIVRYHFLIGPFKFKFNCLNINLTIFSPFEVQKNLKI